MKLFIVRHAWAEDAQQASEADDFHRELTSKGIARFRRQVPLLVERGFRPMIIATSPLLRCRQTAEIIHDFLPDSRVEVVAALSPGARLEELAAWSAPHVAAGNDLAWVGHMPDVSYLTASIDIGNQTPYDLSFSKGAVASLELLGEIGPRMGRLEWLLNARQLGE